MTEKPTPPAWADLTKEEQARRALAALGVDERAADVAIDRCDAVHAAMVELWREFKRQPSMEEIRARSGLGHLPIYTVRDTIARLRAAGRVIQPKARVNIPVIE